MPVYIRESEWSKFADSQILKLLEDWHIVCRENIGEDIEIMISSRYEHPRYRNLKGTLNFALPNTVNGRVFFSLYLENAINFDPVIVSHEICHPLLKIKGLKSMRDDANIQSNEENLLNTLCEHPLVYEEQKKYGHSPNKMINEKATNDRRRMSRTHVRPSYKEKIMEYLVISDSVFNAPRTLSRKIMRNAKKNNKDVYDAVTTIINEMNKKNIFDYDNNIFIKKNIIKKISMEGKWSIRDDLVALRNLCASTSN